MSRGRRAALCGVAVVCGSVVPAVAVTAAVTERVSVSSSGQQGNDISGRFSRPAVSATGQFVAFDSQASNLVGGDQNGTTVDVFLRNRTTGKTTLVSTDSLGRQGNGPSQRPAISANGRFVAFDSNATNLVPGDDNGVFDVFVRDRMLKTTERVSVSSSGTEGNDASFKPSISGDGRFVAFSSDATNLVPMDTNGRRDIFVRDRQAGTTERVSVSSSGAEGNSQSDGPGIRGGLSFGPDISADGRFVTFDSISTNLVPGDTNTCDPFYQDPPGICPDVFVRDRIAGTTVRASVAWDSTGTQGNRASTDPAISADGLVVAFFSSASNLVPGDTNTCPVFPAPGSCPDIFVRVG